MPVACPGVGVVTDAKYLVVLGGQLSVAINKLDDSITNLNMGITH